MITYGCYDHEHVSEREPGSGWTDCMWASGVMFARAVSCADIPTDINEVHALRKASGDLVGGSNIDDLEKGLTQRYGFSGKSGSGFDQFWSEFDPGYVAVLQGKFSALPANLRRFDPDFTGGHAVFLLRRDNALEGWWDDPLAPIGTYDGEYVSKNILRNFYTSLPGARWMIGQVGQFSNGGQMAVIYSLERWSVAAGTAFYDAPDGNKIGTFSKAAVVTTFGVPLDYSTDASPGRNFQWRAALVSTSAMDQQMGLKLVYIKRPSGNPVPTDARWDTYAKHALLNPDSWSSADLTQEIWEAWLKTHP